MHVDKECRIVFHFIKFDFRRRIMDNQTSKKNDQLDRIIAELKEAIPSVTYNSTRETDLSVEQKAIKRFLDERGIHYLIHFTDAENVSSIKKTGILSIEELKRNHIPFKSNDDSRHDNALDYISLSVSEINQFVYKAFRYDRKTIQHGVKVIIDAAILYLEINTPRIYSNTNAANLSAAKGADLEALRGMFADLVEYDDRHFDRNKKTPYQPTDLQAEILWYRCVPSKYILCFWDLEEDFFYGN